MHSTRSIWIRNRLVNPVVRAVLRSPLHGLLSGSLMLITYRGRQTGRVRTIPVMYAEDGARLLVLVAQAPAKRWWRNLRGGAPVEVLVRGRRRRGWASVATGGPRELEPQLRTYLDRFPRAERAAVAGDPVVMVFVDPAASDEEADVSGQGELNDDGVIESRGRAGVR